MIYAFEDKTPRFDPERVWIAETATVIGDVVLEPEVSIWWGAVLRGDNDRLHLGPGCNVQDNAVLHVDPGFPITLEAEVTVGHMAMLHGCSVGRGALIGIRAVVLNGARIGRESLIGAGSVVPEGKEIPERALVLGVPGKVVREVTDADLAMMRGAMESYRKRWPRYRAGLRRLDAPEG